MKKKNELELIHSYINKKHKRALSKLGNRNVSRGLRKFLENNEKQLLRENNEKNR